MLVYFVCPSWVLTLLKGKPFPWMVLSVLCSHRNTSTNNTKYLAIAEISKLSGFSRMEAYRCIDTLTDLGLIEEVGNRKGERMFHLPFLNDISGVRESEVERAENLREEWESHLREMGYSEDEIASDGSFKKKEEVSVKEQLKSMKGGKDV